MRVVTTGSTIRIWASADDTHLWANRPGSRWPCSTLAGHRFFAEFDSNGLLDLTVDGRDADAAPEVDGHELSCCCADLIGAALRGVKAGEDHPAWFVAVGQFEEKS
jgi:hypothetical protein